MIEEDDDDFDIGGIPLTSYNQLNFTEDDFIAYTIHYTDTDGENQWHTSQWSQMDHFAFEEHECYAVHRIIIYMLYIKYAYRYEFTFTLPRKIYHLSIEDATLIPQVKINGESPSHSEIICRHNTQYTCCCVTSIDDPIDMINHTGRLYDRCNLF